MLILYGSFFMGLVLLLKHKKSVLMVLLCFELLFLITFFIMLCSGGLMGNFHSVMILVVFAVVEAVIGLSLLVEMVHVSGNEGVGLVMQIF